MRKVERAAYMSMLLNFLRRTTGNVLASYRTYQPGHREYMTMEAAVYIAIIIHFLRKISSKITYRPRRAPRPVHGAYLYVRDERNPGKAREAIVATVHSEDGTFIRYAFAIERFLPAGFSAYVLTDDCTLPPVIFSMESPFGQKEEMDIMSAVTIAARQYPGILPV